AVRAGNVVLANAPGSGPLESSAMLGFLPAISEQLLGEPLKLPSLATWWCGEAATLANTLPQLKKAVVKSTWPMSGGGTVIGPILNAAGLEQVTGRIVRQPDLHTLQAYLPLSQNPTWEGQDIIPRPAMLRVFALCDG
ncbi:circularly permuted type 2 ATP-grasp protein, partial [Arthrospira platensis SPKY1]|nr:circularly permuted type 2 ATP-grasp protein [Arthrospira platensis SPKY1]